jgi:hypothetical protein
MKLFFGKIVKNKNPALLSKALFMQTSKSKILCAVARLNFEKENFDEAWSLWKFLIEPQLFLYFDDGKKFLIWLEKFEMDKVGGCVWISFYLFGGKIIFSADNFESLKLSFWLVKILNWFAFELKLQSGAGHVELTILLHFNLKKILI